MDYELYLFDYNAFKRELANLLYRAIEEDELEDLADFIAANVSRLKNPLSGAPLDDQWRKKLKPRTVHDFGGIALTAFYTPEQTTVIADWMSLDDILREIQDDLSGLILGYPFGPPQNYFSSGKMGDYFMSTVQAKRTADTLEMLLEQQNEVISQQEGAVERFTRIVAVMTGAIEAGKGVYIRL